MSNRYQKVPLIIEAIELTPNTLDECVEFIGRVFYNRMDCIIYIKTLEGDMEAKDGDFIIKGIEGEFYPCDGNIFKKSYVRVD